MVKNNVNNKTPTHFGHRRQSQNTTVLMKKMSRMLQEPTNSNNTQSQHKNTIISLYTTEIEFFTDLPIAKIVKEGSISLNALLYCAITLEVAKL